jgi:hypothetical protein
MHPHTRRVIHSRMVHSRKGNATYCFGCQVTPRHHHCSADIVTRFVYGAGVADVVIGPTIDHFLTPRWIRAVRRAQVEDDSHT